MSKNEKLQEIMEKKYNPRDLAKQQHDALKQHILDTLDTIKNQVAVGNYEAVIREHTFQSPSGDYTGMDSTVIDFGYDENNMDIYEVLNHLAFLQNYANGKIEVDTTYSEYNVYLNTEEL